MAEFKADWEIGSLSTTTGAELSSGSVARTGLIDVQEKVTFPFSVSGTFGTQNCTILFYADTTYIKSTFELADTSPYTITPPSNATKMRVTTKSTPVRNYSDADLLVLKDEFVFENSAEPPVVDEFVSAQSGVWSNTATWAGGVVPTLDKKVTVLAAHTVTLDVNVSPFSGEIEVQGELALDGTTFTVGVKNGVTGKFYLNNGTLSGTGSVHMHRGEFKTIGDSWSYIKDSVNIGYESTSTVQGISWHLDKLSVVSSGEFKPHYRLGDGAPTFHLNNCVFEGLSLLELGANASAIYAPISMTKCTIKDCTEIEFAGGGSATVTDCVIYTYDSATARTPIRATSMAVKYINTALLDCSFSGDSSQQNFESVFILSDTKSGGSYVVSSNLNPLSSMVDSVAYGVVGTGGASNNRMSKLYTHKNCFFSDTTLGGSNGLMIMGNYGDITGNVFTGKGAGITLYAYHSETNPEIAISSNIVNNTFFMDNGAYPLNSERYYSLESSNVVIKNNVSYHDEPTTRDFIAWSNYGDTFTSKVYINFDYNTMINTPDWYNTGLYANGLSNANSLNNLDPRFKDPRTVLDWGKTVGANTDSEIKLYFLARNGYNSTTKIHSGTVVEVDIKSITTWIKDGYTPTNMALATSGEGGTFIGALEPQEIVVEPTADLTLEVNLSSVTVGGDITYTLRLTGAVNDSTSVVLTIAGVDRTVIISAGSTSATTAYTTVSVGNVVADVKSVSNSNVTDISSAVTTVVNEVVPSVVTNAILFDGVKVADLGGGSGGVTSHPLLSDRSNANQHPQSAITGLVEDITRLNNGYNSIDDKFTEQVEILHADIKEAYINTIAFPVVDESYNVKNTYITFNERIYKANKDTIWTGVLNADWDDVLMFPQEIRDYVANAIEASASGEFPLQLRPDATDGTYNTIEDAPLTDNQQGYLVTILEDSAGGNAGLYIWSKRTEADPLSWLPFVSLPDINENNLDVTFRGAVDTLKQTMVAIDNYVTASVKGETDARTAALAATNADVTALKNNALQIGGNAFRGTQAEFDEDPEKNNYYLAIIVG